MTTKVCSSAYPKGPLGRNLTGIGWEDISIHICKRSRSVFHGYDKGQKFELLRNLVSQLLRFDQITQKADHNF